MSGGHKLIMFLFVDAVLDAFHHAAFDLGSPFLVVFGVEVVFGLALNVRLEGRSQG